MRNTVHLDAADPADVQRAAEILQRGGLVAFPTETVYGLGANAFSAQAVEGIFRAKERPSWDPLIVHLPDADQLRRVASVGEGLRDRVAALSGDFWPGPLTLLLPRTADVPELVTAGRALVGVRVPGHPVARALLRATDLPLAAPSANRFGHTSPTTARHVLDDLGGRIDAVLDAGPCSVGVESTVLDPAPTPMIVYRAGAVTREQIAATAGVPARFFLEPMRDETMVDPESLPSPGVGLRHYAPEAAVQLAPGTPEELQRAVLDALRSGARVGVLLPGQWRLKDGNVEVQRWGLWNEPASLAAGLFAGLRALEQKGVDIIVCPLPEPGGFFDAIRDRLLKAAKPR